MRLVIVLSAGLAVLAASSPALAADLRLLQRDDAQALFVDLDLSRTDRDGVRHGVVYAVSVNALPNSHAQFSRFDDVVDCESRRIATAVITGYGREFQVVQRLSAPPRWAPPNPTNQAEFDLFCAAAPRTAGLRRLPTRDWKEAAAQILVRLAARLGDDR